MPNVRRIVRGVFRGCYHWFLSLASQPIDRELTRRDSRRGGGNLRWFTPEEAEVAAALANVIVPSDEETPGLDDIDVLGPSATTMLDKLLQADRHKQDVYARGLLSFDLWAIRKHGCPFAKLTAGDQLALFQQAQQFNEKLSSGSRVIRAWRLLCGVTQAAKGPLFAARLFPEIRNDCFQVFYTSRVSWVWLEYDGPPMDEGYPKLTARHGV